MIIQSTLKKMVMTVSKILTALFRNMLIGLAMYGYAQVGMPYQEFTEEDFKEHP